MMEHMHRVQRSHSSLRPRGRHQAGRHWVVSLRIDASATNRSFNSAVVRDGEAMESSKTFCRHERLILRLATAIALD